MVRKAALLDRIDQLLKLGPVGLAGQSLELIPATLSVLIEVYGERDLRVKDFVNARKSCSNMSLHSVATEMSQFALAALRSAKADIEIGLITSLERRYSGYVISDFVLLARQASEAGHVEVSAVLACAALEDALKRTGVLAGLSVSELDMPEVITELVKAEVIIGPQSKLVRSFTAIRNKAMHAEFDKIDSADVKAVLGFTEESVVSGEILVRGI